MCGGIYLVIRNVLFVTRTKLNATLHSDETQALNSYYLLYYVLRCIHALLSLSLLMVSETFSNHNHRTWHIERNINDEMHYKSFAKVCNNKFNLRGCIFVPQMYHLQRCCAACNIQLFITILIIFNTNNRSNN